MDQKLDMYLKNTNSNRYPINAYVINIKDLFCIFKNIYFQSKTKGKSQTILL